MGSHPYACRDAGVCRANLHVDNAYGMLLPRKNGTFQRLELDMIIAITIFDDHDLEPSSIKPSSANTRTCTHYFSIQIVNIIEPFHLD